MDVKYKELMNYKYNFEDPYKIAKELKQTKL